MNLAHSLIWSVALFAGGAQASVLWRWSYHGAGVSASGTLTTEDAANADGFYRIVGIDGEANGVAIARLQPAGEAIPGNEGYPTDNLLRAGGLQLTKHGFAFALADGSYANPFYGAHFIVPGYYVFNSNPAAGLTSEPAVAFTAAIVP